LVALALQAAGVGRRGCGGSGIALFPAFLTLARATHHGARRGGLFGAVLPVVLFGIVIDTIIKLVVLTTAPAAPAAAPTAAPLSRPPEGVEVDAAL